MYINAGTRTAYYDATITLADAEAIAELGKQRIYNEERKAAKGAPWRIWVASSPEEPKTGASSKP